MLHLKAKRLIAAYHILVSTAESKRGVNCFQPGVNLHCPTQQQLRGTVPPSGHVIRQRIALVGVERAREPKVAQLQGVAAQVAAAVQGLTLVCIFLV